MQRYALLALGLLLAVLGPGCVERRFVIESDPPGAMVYRNGIPLGLTPVDDHFVYYGKYNFTLTRAQFETLHVTEDIAAPWYELPGVDFVSENIYPFTVRDVRRLKYSLKPLQPDNPQDLLKEAQFLRARGQTIGEQPAHPVPPPGPLRGPGVPAGPAAVPGPAAAPAVVPAPPPGGGPPPPLVPQMPPRLP